MGVERKSTRGRDGGENEERFDFELASSVESNGGDEIAICKARFGKFVRL